MSTSDRTSRNDAGNVLILTMALVIVMGAVTIAFLGRLDTNFRHSNSSSELQDRLFAVQGGLEVAVKLTIDNGGGCPPPIEPIDLNGQSVSFECDDITSAPAVLVTATSVVSDAKNVAAAALVDFAQPIPAPTTWTVSNP